VCSSPAELPWAHCTLRLSSLRGGHLGATMCHEPSLLECLKDLSACMSCMGAQTLPTPSLSHGDPNRSRNTPLLRLTLTGSQLGVGLLSNLRLLILDRCSQVCLPAILLSAGPWATRIPRPPDLKGR
jgi:hypothetical protein